MVDFNREKRVDEVFGLIILAVTIILIVLFAIGIKFCPADAEYTEPQAVIAIEECFKCAIAMPINANAVKN